MILEHRCNDSVLLLNLNTYINKDEVTESIFKLSEKISKIESISGKSPYTIGKRNEIEKLEEKLAYSQTQAKIRNQMRESKLTSFQNQVIGNFD